MSTVDISAPASPEVAGGLHGLLGRGLAVLGSHAVIDAYAVIVPCMIGLIEARCQLTAIQTSVVVASTTLVSGLCQPIFAAISDRYDTRLFGGLGLGVAAVFLCQIGRAATFPQLLALVCIGYFGVGIFHPIAASTMGQLGGRRRSLAMSGFFVSGMVGAAIGAVALPRFVGSASGLGRLSWFTLPGMLLAVALHMLLRRATHRQSRRVANRHWDGPDARQRWRGLWLLYVTTTMRAAVYVTIQYMFLRYAQQYVALHEAAGQSGTEIANLAAPIVGDLVSMTIVGMAVGGLACGLLVRHGQERWPLVLVPILFAPAVALLPLGPPAAARWLGLLSAVGFASLSPVALSLAQRLLPHRTSFASSLMLGGAWAVGAIGPTLAEWALPSCGVRGVYLCCAVLLAGSGLLALYLGDVVRSLDAE